MTTFWDVTTLESWATESRWLGICDTHGNVVVTAEDVQDATLYWLLHGNVYWFRTPGTDAGLTAIDLDTRWWTFWEPIDVDAYILDPEEERSWYITQGESHGEAEKRYRQETHEAGSG